MPKIGIPRAFHFYRYYPAMRAFFEALGVEPVVSEPTTKATVTNGLKCVVAESCLPLKVFCGHVMNLADKADFVFVPSIRSVETDLYNCIKLFALPDQVRGAVAGAPPVLDMLFDVNLGRKAVYNELYRVGRYLGSNRGRVDRACEVAHKAHVRYSQLLHRGFSPLEALEVIDGGPESDFLGQQLPPDAPKVALVGHHYNLYDDYLNHDVVKKLGNMGLRIVTGDCATLEQLNTGVGRVIGSAYWMNEREITGAAGHYLYCNGVDGVIVVTVFGCGPDSMMIDAVQRTAKKGNCNPLLCLTLDEHTAEAGLVTRLEAFVDTMRRKKSASFVISTPQVIAPIKPSFGKDLKLAFPHMGTAHVAIRVLFNKLEVDCVVPPPCNQRSLDLAAKYSPEYACVPYKLTLGNFLDALESGANALTLLTGPNNCRFGYYHKLQEQVLRDLGYEFQMVLPEISGRTLGRVGEVLHEASGKSARECMSAAMLALNVQQELDAIERKVQYIRPRELRVGGVNKIWDEAIEAMARVTSKDSLRATRKMLDERLEAVPIDKTRDPVRICIVGEIYVVQEPYINHDLEVELGRLGVEANRSEQISQWLSVFPGIILDRLGLGHNARIKKAEMPYLRFWSGETVGQTVMAAEDGYDGVIQLAPFTCTPEVVAQNVLPKLRRDVDIPVLTIILDEQTARTGLKTRLEAFVDLLQRRRNLVGQPRAKPGIVKLFHLLRP
ncbi:MAG: hypothetical protein HY675_00720 [Chloroflexi bacterium]|nr:hypothetical protein [Chloroflexota bacterium]